MPNPATDAVAPAATDAAASNVTKLTRSVWQSSAGAGLGDELRASAETVGCADARRVGQKLPQPDPQADPVSRNAADLAPRLKNPDGGTVATGLVVDMDDAAACESEGVRHGRTR